VVCSGEFYAATQSAESGVLLLDVTTAPPRVLRRFDVAAALGEVPGPSVAFASEDLLLGTTYGDLDTGSADQAFLIDASSGQIRQLAQASSAFVYGDVRCCAESCALADTDKNGLYFWTIVDDRVSAPSLVQIHGAAGLPPRYLGAF